MTDHTPGPWSVGHVGNCVHDVMQIHGADGCLLFNINHSSRSATDDQMQPNAHLIAAAPELLTAAIKVLDHLNTRMKEAGKAQAPVPVFVGIADLHSAIAKAKAHS